MEKFELPHLGSRNIKTGLSVLICLIFWPNSLFAAIAAVICMQDTVENSVKIGLNRLIGTLLGGTLGVLLLFTINKLNLTSFATVITALGVSLIIYICNIIKKPAACSIASIVLIGILISHRYDDPLMYSIRRTVETAFGIIIALIINKYIHPPKSKKQKTNEKLENVNNK
ncbi:MULTISPECIES: aromatic acid exporter family protein [unclassified Clostridium]|uniref:FUSC family protein n=1 Tax=unclassified Clostridium TaxID=2614128 RepID=UPI00189A31A0|nr:MULTISPECIES: aromatic acid exporter family protein [unclassified Clostridium]